MLPEKSYEFQFIDQIRQAAKMANGVQIGIGDDAAAVTFESGRPAIVTSDMLLDGVHFEIPPATPIQVGRKAMNVNLSDLAAMAAIPRFAVVSVCFPRQSGDLGNEVMQGLLEAGDEFNVSLVGGDTNSWDGPLIINVTAIGEAHSKGVVTRSGARPGDWICVTGDLGGSLVAKHLDFSPRVREALFLQEATSLTSMMDISDGLVSDLYHILEESQCGATLEASSIPISEAAAAMDGEKSPLERALGDGEDFELLFTLGAAEGQKLIERADLPVRLTRVGEITAAQKCLLQKEGQITELPRLGWSHAFRD